MHFKWVQLCQDFPWLIEHISCGNEANRNAQKKEKESQHTVHGSVYLPEPKSDTCEAARSQTA